jgi:hypothetical protein
MLLKAGRSWEGQSWFDRMTGNRNEEYQVALQRAVPLEIKE